MSDCSVRNTFSIRTKGDFMRRLMAAAAITSVLLLGAGCGSSSDSASGTSSSAPAVPASSAAAAPSASGGASDNTKVVCAEIKTINGEYVPKVTAAFTKMTQEQLSGNADAAKKTMTELTALGKEWAAKLAPVAAKSNNPELNKLVTDLGTQLRKLESGTANTAEVATAVSNANTQLNKICG
jgi:hypothetical protein